MRLLFTSRPGVGHLFPLLPLAAAALHAGHDVIVATAEVNRSAVEAGGFEFSPTSENLADAAAVTATLAPDRIRHFMFEKRFADVELASRLPDLQNLVASWRPEVVVHELSEFAGSVAAAQAGIPSATLSFGPMLQPDVLELAARSAAKHWRSAGLEPEPAAGIYTHLYLDICPPALQVPEMAAIPVARRLRPVPFGAGDGPSPDPLGPLDGPVVYFTMGTVYGRDAALFRTVVAGIHEVAGSVVVTVGGRIDPRDLGQQPANVQVHGFIPQAHLLARCDLVVTHGGSGSLLGALGAGLPVLLLPQGADQFYNSERVLAAGVGMVLRPPEVTSQSVREAVRDLLAGASYRERARAVAAEIAAMPSPATALLDLEKLARGGKG